MAKIITINIDGRLTKLIKLTRIIKREQLTIINIQDLPSMTERNLERTFSTHLTNYRPVYRRTNNPDTNNKATTLTLYNSEQVQLMNATHHDTNLISATLITGQIKEVQEHDIHIVNIYIRPRASHQDITKLAEWIIQTKSTLNLNPAHLIIAGDMNASSPLWDPQFSLNTPNNTYERLKRSRGQQLTRLIQRIKGHILNPKDGQSTFKHNNGNKLAYIDIITGGEKIVRKLQKSWTKEIDRMSAGHKMIGITLRTTGLNMTINTTKARQKTQYKLEHKHFLELQIETEEILMSQPTSNRKELANKMNQLTEALYKNLLEIQHKLKPPTRSNRKPNNQHTNYNAHTTKLINKLKKIERKKGRKTNARKTNKLRNRIIQQTQAHNIQQLINKQPTKSLWTNINLINAQDNQSNIENQTNKNTELNNRKTLNNIATEKFPQIHREAQDKLNELEQLNLIDHSNIEERELELAIRNSRNKKHTGPEGLKFKTFNETIPYTKHIIYEIAKLSFQTNKVPRICEHTQGIIIPKKNPGTYRIVHVGTPLANILEQIALHRLEYALEESMQYADNQYGFTAKRGRQDLIARAIAMAVKHQAASPRNYTSITSLDIQGAFDNVDQDGIINKIIKELWPDPIRHWLANYILNREIVIKYGTAKSDSRKVCKGVPQGSPLGPILWNYTINNLDKDINNEQTQMLTYADDIILIDNSNNQEHTQNIINTITTRLAQLKLEIKAEKCAHLKLKLDRPYTDNNQTTLKINGTPITNVDKLNILGVRITNRGKLDTDSTEMKTAIEKATTNLHRINQLNIIYKTEEWQVLIESYLASIIQYNNSIIMTIDQKAIEWADKTMANAIKCIFNWPQNVSNKLAMMITGTKPSKLVAIKTLLTRISSEHKQHYQLLMRKLEGAQMIDTNLYELAPPKINTVRRYYNPRTNITVHQYNPRSNEMIIWTILESNQNATAIETTMNPIIPINTVQIRHANHAISFFNTLTLLWKMAQDSTIVNRNLLLATNNALLLAIRNEVGNHDWRIIRIRELLAEGNWNIITAEPSTVKQLKRTLKEQLKTQQGDETQPRTTITSLIPNLDDYIINNHNRKLYRRLTKQAMNQQHTYMTQFINPDTDKWKEYSPTWLTPHNALMLSGLNSVHGQLDHGNLKPGTRPDDCNTNNDCRINKGNNELEKHATIHRATNCLRFMDVRTKLMDLIGEETNIRRGLNLAMKDKLKNQGLVRILTEAAFP